jgi:fatty-acyl-CoA synthase
MTEMTAGGTIARCPPDLEHAPMDRQMSGGRRIPNPFYEIRRARRRGVPWDGRTMGEIEVRGPMVADYTTAVRIRVRSPKIAGCGRATSE